MDIFPKYFHIAIDKWQQVWYNDIMIKNITNKERRIKMLHLNEIVAIKMQDGLTIEKDQITEIGNVLVAMGKSLTERIWLLSHDEDFIPDVLSCYNHKNG